MTNGRFVRVRHKAVVNSMKHGYQPPTLAPHHPPPIPELVTCKILDSTDHLLGQSMRKLLILNEFTNTILFYSSFILKNE